MGRKVLIAALCCLALQAEGDVQNSVNSSTVKDNNSAQSVLHQQFLHYEPVRTYASDVPYNTLTIPSRLLQQQPVTSGSQIVPVKEESFVLRSQAGFLKDSYGNKFVGTPHTLAYKTSLPQQFVRLQDLPLHLSQPLVAQPGFAFNGRMFGLPGHSTASTTPLIRYSNAPRLQMYAEQMKNYFPETERFSVSKSPQQQSTNREIVYANKHPSGNSPNQRFQRLEENPDNDQNTVNLPKIQAAEQVTVTTVDNNGKKTTVTLATKPHLPLVDLSLLKPLTFANPIVPQVQHFLPPITYELPGVESHHQSDEFVVQKTKSYDTGIISGKPQEEEIEDDDDTDEPPRKPIQHAETPENSESDDEEPPVKENRNHGAPEYSYEINSPNHKEVYNEQVINYDKKTEDEPVHYTYSEKTEKKPVSYSYTTSSKEPVQNIHQGSPNPIHHTYSENNEKNPESHSYTTSSKEPVNHVHYEAPKQIHHTYSEKTEKMPVSYSYSTSSKVPVKNVHYRQSPKKLIYTIQDEDNDQREHSPSPQHTSQNESEESGESDESAENSSEHNSEEDDHNEQPKQSYHLKPPHRDEHYRPNPQAIRVINYQGEASKPAYYPPSGQRQGKYPMTDHHVYNNPYNIVYGKPPHSQQIRVPVHSLPNPEQENIHLVHTNPQNAPMQVNNDHQSQNQRDISHNGPVHQQHHPRNHKQSNGEIRYQHPVSSPNSQRHHVSAPRPNPPQQKKNHQSLSPHPPSHRPHHDKPSREPTPTQYDEYHDRVREKQQHYPGTPSPSSQHTNAEHDSASPDFDSNPHIIEKSRKIIIQEESPEEKHSHMEQMMAEMIHQGDDTKEEDFEKAYKESALGFPGYDRDPAQIEKDIYNPESYGNPKTAELNFDDTQFKQYQEDGDEFPKKARLTYKDDINNMKEDYFLDYSVSQPESLLDRHKSKVNYYKMFMKQKPKNYFAEEPKKRQKSERYTADPIGFHSFEQKPKKKKKNYFAAYKQKPKFEFDYAKEARHDNSAFPSGFIRQTKTLFVEPQFQYGFEPISLPSLFDSELSAMATNLSPEGEKEGSRKKIYQENWYIKKSGTKNRPVS